MNSIRRMTQLALLLTVGQCAVHGQSIVVSGGHRSIVVSGSESARSQATVSVPKSVIQPQKGSDPTSSTSPVAKDLLQHAEPQAAGEVSHTIRLQQWGASWCPSCPGGKAQAQSAADQLGIRLEYFDYDQNNQLAKSLGVNSVPQTHVVIDGKILYRFVGQTPAAQIVAGARTLAGSQPAGPLVSRPARTTHASAGVSPPSRHVMYGNQQIDLETYGGCSSRRCGMCATLRAQQAEYRRLKAIYEASQYRQTSLIPDHQQPTPDDVLRDVIDELAMRETDVFADIGCGDGRVLIAAVERYGCKAIGIEIDPVKADEARANVQAAGLSNRITIVTGDALRFWPADHGVTHAVAYLYPDLLEQLRPNLEQVRVLVIPFHAVPGMEMEQAGDVFVRRITQSANRSQPVRLISRGGGCPNGRCPR